MNEKLLTFGKYKNQPVEILQSDPNYKNWLTGQDWFKSQHRNLYTLIINNFGEPLDTPEHNKLQGFFLERDFCIAFSRFVNPSFFEDVENTPVTISGISTTSFFLKADTIESIDVCDLKFEEEGIDVSFSIRVSFRNKFTRKTSDEEWIKQVESHSKWSKVFKVEIKPSVGDDYPSVLRQMKASGAGYLLVGNYCGEGIDRRAFIKLFQSQNKKVIFVEDVMV